MHQSVLLEETVQALVVGDGGMFIDATVGSGGHAEAILQRAGGLGRLLGLDQDQEALARASQRLAQLKDRCILRHANFGTLGEVAREDGFVDVDGILMDLGMSSEQVDTAERGFSFLHDGPLDMRMDRGRTRTAGDLINTLQEKHLADLLWRYGEERASRRIARFVAENREKAPIETTHQLADLVVRAKGGRKGKTHPATKTFQALRMAVNDEMGNLETGLEAAINLLRPSGRVAVISFHSIEDRCVKQFFARHVGRWESLQEGGRSWRGGQPPVKKVTRKPIVAGDEEAKANPRSRSAKLRVVERIDHGA